MAAAQVRIAAGQRELEDARAEIEDLRQTLDNTLEQVASHGPGRGCQQQDKPPFQQQQAAAFQNSLLQIFQLVDRYVRLYKQQVVHLLQEFVKDCFLYSNRQQDASKNYQVFFVAKRITGFNRVLQSLSFFCFARH